jgi:hypothetical protein
MRSDIAPGRTFPDYELPDHEDVPRRLSDLQGEDQLIPTLVRPLLPQGAPAARIQEYTDPGNDPMIPRTLVLEPGLPGLREAWDAGNLSRFRGWDERAATSV